MKKILLVNDSKFECMIIKDILNNLGYQVVIGDENNALSLIANEKIDFVLVNYIMQEITGDQLIVLIKAIHPTLKCILSSSNAISPEQFKHKKIDAFFHTPIDGKGLQQVIDGVDFKNEKIEEQMEIIRPIKAKTIDLEKPKEDTPRFCAYCGQRLDKEKEKSFTFCPFCGHKL